MEYKDYMAFADSLLAQRDLYKADFEERARMVLPTSYAAMMALQGTDLPSYISYCEEANQACQTLASAHMQLLTPFDKRWFDITLLSVGSQKLGDAAQRWQAQAADAMWSNLGKSNFTSAINEMYLDRCAVGHGAIHARVDEHGRLVFTAIAAATFGIALNEHYICNTLCREFKLTAAQAVARWGSKGVSAKVKKAYDDPKSRFSEMFDFIHLVMPNEKGQRGLMARSINERPYIEVTLSKTDKKVIEQNGLYEFPYLVTRFLKWGESPFGTAPASLCRSSIIKLEKNEAVMDLLGEKAVEPPIVIDEESTGRINMMPGGVTPISRDMRMPQALVPQGQYNIGLERSNKYEAKIKAAFYYDIVRPLAGLTHDMTASEVRARQQENILSFVHSFSMMTAELAPFIRAIYSMLHRWATVNEKLGADGVMPAIAQEVLPLVMQSTEDGKDVVFSEFEISFTSRLAIALKEISLDGDIQAIRVLSELMQGLDAAELKDNMNLDKAFRKHARGMNVSSDILRSEKEVAQMRAQRAQMQAAQMEMQAAQMQAGTAKDLAAAGQKGAVR